jgi:hypothetical protein
LVVTRYFFHFLSPGRREEDLIGLEFETPDSAYIGAWEGALEISTEMLKAGQNPGPCAFEVWDANSCLAFELPFAEVLRPPVRRPPKAAELAARLERTARMHAAQRAFNDEMTTSVQRVRETLSAIRGTLSEF